jgi:hypothetical protein
LGGNIKFMSETGRLSRDEYFALEQEVDAKILTNGKIVDYDFEKNPREILQPIKAYFSKESYGDMDLIVRSDVLYPDWIPQLVKEFGLGHGDWSKNGNVLSFAYKNFQIDLIVTPPEHFQTSLDYFAWNDCGNLQGRISHKLGIKLGHRGAELIIKDGDQQIGIIELTRDTEKIHELLDLDHMEWKYGFNTLEDMYRWISDSKYFNKDIYLLDNRNHYSRTRDNKRKTYSDFLIWCQNQDFVNHYPHDVITEKDGYNIREPFFSELIVPMFPHAKEQYDAIVHDNNQRKAFKVKFNGKIVMELTGLEGKELGAFMTWAKESMENRGIIHMISSYGEHTVNQIIKSLFLHYQQGWVWGGVPIQDVKRYMYGENYAEIAPDVEYSPEEFELGYGIDD